MFSVSIYLLFKYLLILISRPKGDLVYKETIPQGIAKGEWDLECFSKVIEFKRIDLE